MTLPVPATRFVGRSEELSRLRALFDRGARCVTLFGAGGAGKTRLALRHLDEQVDQETRFCDLTSASSSGEVLAVLATELALELPARAPPEEITTRIVRALGTRTTLLVLDNCEHVVEEAARVATRLLADAPNARLLVTSRELLNVPGETAFEVGPLELPKSSHDVETEAVALFLDRARLVRAESPASDLDAIASIVRRLDGLPLAIELAAARTAVMSPADILSRLGKDLDVLAVRARGVPDRHRTLRAAMDWSWALLTRSEQAALAQCALFRGTFSLEGASAVIDVPEPLDILESLRSKSWLRAVVDGGDVRFALYETIRTFAEEKLDDPTRTSARARFLAYYLARSAETIDVAASDVSARDALLERDLDNVVLAQEQALRASPPRVDDAMLLALSLERVLRARGAAPTLLGLVHAVEDASVRTGARIRPALHARGLVARAEAASVVASTRRGRRDLEDALALAEEAGDPLAFGRAKAGIAFLEALVHGPVHARPLFDEALALQRAARDPAGEAKTLVRYGFSEFTQRNVEEARAKLTLAIARAEAVGDLALCSLGLRYLAYVRFLASELEAAIADYERAIALGRRTGRAFNEGLFAQDIAIVYQELGRWSEAEALYRTAIAAHAREIAEGRLGRALLYYASLHHERGAHDAAAEHYRRGLELLRHAGPAYELIMMLGRAFSAGNDAARGLVDDASHVLDEIERAAERLGQICIVGVVDVFRGHVELSRARTLLEGGDREGARAAAQAAEARLAEHSAQIPFDDLRFARRVLARGVESFPVDAVVVGSDGAWFALPSGARVQLDRNKRLRPILRALADGRLSGVPSTIDDLFARAWPGERVPDSVRANRVRVAVAALRDAGLRDLIVHESGGYVLARGIDVIIAAS
jgi:predicted ATPase